MRRKFGYLKPLPLLHSQSVTCIIQIMTLTDIVPSAFVPKPLTVVVVGAGYVKQGLMSEFVLTALTVFLAFSLLMM